MLSASVSAIFGERQRALIDLAARTPGHGRDLAHRLLDRNPPQGLPQQGVDIGALGLGRAAAARSRSRSRRAALRSRVVRPGREIAAADLLVELGELAADGGLAVRRARPRDRRASGDARPGLEQHQRGRNEPDLGDAGAPLAFAGGRNPSNMNRSVGKPATVSAASTAEAPGSAVTAWPAARAARASLKPGSEISGVPASETSATAAPAASRARSFGRAARHCARDRA